MTFSTNRHCLDYDSPGTIDNKCNKSDYSVDVDIDIDLQILITQDLQFISKKSPHYYQLSRPLPAEVHTQPKQEWVLPLGGREKKPINSFCSPSLIMFFLREDAVVTISLAMNSARTAKWLFQQVLVLCD